MNLPDYNFLSAPLWLINLLHWITLSLHFAAMNFVFGGLVTILFGKFDNKWQNPFVKKYLKLLPTAMAATITFGVAPLLFVQLVFPQQVYGASIVSGWFWLLIIAAVILVYYALYGASFGADKSPRKGIWLSLALIGMLYVSYVYTSVFTLAENPTLYAEVYAANQSGWALNPEVGDYLFRWLHMLFGAVTVGGFFVGWLGEENSQAYAAGKTFFTGGMIAAALFGFIYLFMLGDILVPFMRTPAIWALTLGIFLSVGSLHFYFKKRFVIGGLMVLVSLITMVISRHYVRLLRLADHYDPSTMPVAMQWSIFLLFLVCFLLAIGLLWYMLKLFFARAKA